MLVGGKQGAGVHPFWGRWTCHQCRRKMERRERDVLDNLKTSNAIEMDDSQEERLEVLQSRRRSEVRARTMEDRGEETVWQEDRNRLRANGLSSATKNKKKAYNKARDAARPPRKKSDKADRAYKSNEPYPKSFMKKLHKASVLFWSYQGPNVTTTWRSNIIRLYIRVLEAEINNLPADCNRRNHAGFLKYRTGPFEAALEKYCEQDPDNTQYYKPKPEFLRRLKGKYQEKLGMRMEDIYDAIVREICGNGNSNSDSNGN